MLDLGDSESTATAGNATTPQSGSVRSSGAVRSDLRGMSYAEGEAALTPVQRQEAPGSGGETAEGGATQGAATPAGGQLTLDELRAFRVRRDPLQAQMDAALQQQQPGATEDPVRARDLREQLRRMDAPMLPRLRALLQGGGGASLNGDESERVELRDMAVRMLQEASVVSAENALASGGQGAGAYNATRHVGRADWCGMYTAAMMIRGGGLDDELRPAFSHERGVEAFFNYRPGHGNVLYIQTEDGAWTTVSAYHTLRGSRRDWKSVTELHSVAHTGLDLRPGDTVLLNVAVGERGDHIAMVHSYHPGTGRLTTVDGNGNGFIVDARAAQRLRARPDAAGPNAAGPNAPAQPEGATAGPSRERNVETDLGAPVRAGPAPAPHTPGSGHVGIHSMDVDRERTDDRPEARPRGGPAPVYYVLHGRGRPSLVDFESHTYSPTNPTPAPASARPPRHVSR